MIDKTLFDMMPVIGCDCFVPNKRQWKSTAFQLLHQGEGRPNIRVAESPVRLTERQVLIVQPGQTISLAESGMDLRCIAFRSPFLQTVFDRFRPIRPVVSTLNDRTRDTLHELWTIHTVDALPLEPLKASCVLFSLVAHLVANVSWDAAAEKNLPNETVGKSAPLRIGEGKFIIYAARFMKKRMADPDLSLPDIARAIGYHPNYFAQQFSQVMNISPMKYLKAIRVERAIQLLEATDDEVQTICEKVGIKKSNSLSAMIKERTGMKPVQYRRQVKISKMMWKGVAGSQTS